MEHCSKGKCNLLALFEEEPDKERRNGGERKTECVEGISDREIDLRFLGVRSLSQHGGEMLISVDPG
jgi:hypothetical protein